MDSRKLGVIQIILGSIIILNEISQISYGVFATLSKKILKFIFYLIFDPLVWFATILIILGIFFLKNRPDKIFENILPIKLINKSQSGLVGGFCLFLGICVFLINVYAAGLFSDFSISRIGALFFDDAKMPYTIVAISLSIFGSYVIKNS